MRYYVDYNTVQDTYILVDRLFNEKIGFFPKMQTANDIADLLNKDCKKDPENE